MPLFKPNVKKMTAKKDIEGLIELLSAKKYRDADAAEEAAEALGQIGDPRAVWPLVEALNSARTQSFANKAGEALGRIGNKEAVQPLIDYLTRSPSSGVAWALGEIGDARAVAPLVGLLKAAPANAAWVAEPLGKIGDARAVQPLVECLSSDDPRAVSEAVLTLGKIGDSAAVGPLIKTLKGEYLAALQKEVAEAFVKAVGRRGGTRAVRIAQGAWERGDPDSAMGAMRAFAEYGAAGIELSIRAQRVHPERWRLARERAAQALGDMRDVRSVEPLIQTLADDNVFIRGAAAEALVKIGEPAVEPLIEALTGPPHWRGTKAAEHADDAAVEFGIKFVERELYGEDRARVAEVLGEIGDARAIEPLRERLKDTSENVRRAAQKALRNME